MSDTSAVNGERPEFKLHLELKGHERAISSVKFQPITGALLASASADTTTKLWNPNDGSLLRTLEGHSQGVNDVAWNQQGNYICTASDDKTLKLWDAETGKCLRTLKGHTNFVFCCNWDPHGHLLASGSFDETVRLWDVRSGACLRELPAHSDPVTAVGFNTDGTLIASSSFDGLCRIWDTQTGHCLKTLIDKDNPPVSFVNFCPNGQYMLSSTLDSKIRLWDFKKGVWVKMYSGHTNTKFCCTAVFCTNTGKSADGEPRTPWVVSGSEDSSIYVWDLNTQEVLQVIQGCAEGEGGDGHTDAVLCVDAHPQRAMVASGSHEKNKVVKLWLHGE